jgi:putative colanic acid biosynthesis acetyltransferase WcaF
MKEVNNASYRTTIDIGASRPKQIIWYFVNIFFFKNSLNVFSGIKIFLLKLFGAKLGRGVVIKPSVNIKYPWKLQMGSYSWIGEEVWIDNLSDVIIGNNVTLSQGALLLTGSHDHTKQTFDFISSPIILEDGVWIGTKAIVFGGVICKSHSILGMNSVAEKNLEPYIIYKGNPATAVIERTIF